MAETRRQANSPPYKNESDTGQVEALEATTNPICGYFSDNPDYGAACASPSTCSTPSGGSSWGCCNGTSCYIPATCEDGRAPNCMGTASSLCPYYPIMKCTYGSSSLCVHFVYQTASDDIAKVTSWGCDVTPKTYIIGPLQGRQTSHHTATATASTNDGTHTSSVLSKDTTIILAVILPVVGLAILIATTMLLLKRRHRRAPDIIPTLRQVDGIARPEMGQTAESASVPAVHPQEIYDDSMRPELDSCEVGYRTS